MAEAVNYDISGYEHLAGEVLDLSFALEGMSMASADLLEAIAAFREKRRPTYHGT